MRFYNSHWWKPSLKEERFTNEISMKQIIEEFIFEIYDLMRKNEENAVFSFFHGELSKTQ